MCDVIVKILHMTRQYRLVWKWVTPNGFSTFSPWNGNFGVSLFSDTPVHWRSSLYNLIGCRSVFQRFAHRKSCKLQPPLRIVLSNLPSASRKVLQGPKVETLRKATPYHLIAIMVIHFSISFLGSLAWEIWQCPSRFGPVLRSSCPAAGDGKAGTPFGFKA